LDGSDDDPATPPFRYVHLYGCGSPGPRRNAAGERIGPRQSAKGGVRRKGRGVALWCSHELPYATNRDGKASSLAALSSIDLMLTTVSKQQSHFQHRQR